VSARDDAGRVPPEGGHREGIVEVYDDTGRYLGCMGARRWERLMVEDQQSESSKGRRMSERAALFGQPGMGIEDAAKEACAVAAERDSTVYLVFNERLVQVTPEAAWPEVVHAYWKHWEASR
jgi:hypothetical protein